MSLRNPTYGGITLLDSPVLQRAWESLRQSIVKGCAPLAPIQCKSACLIRWEYVLEERDGGKCCTHYNALVRVPGRDDVIQMRVTITADTGEEECYQL